MIENESKFARPTWLLFDWGDTLMRVYPEFKGPMVSWPRLDSLPGAVETLSALSQHYHLALATNAEDSGEDQIRAALRQVGLDPWIEEIFCTRRLGRQKPDREYFLAIADILLADPKDMVMIGDSFMNDVQGAVDAGLCGIWLNTLSAEDRRGARYATVHSLGEIIPMLLSLQHSTYSTQLHRDKEER